MNRKAAINITFVIIGVYALHNHVSIVSNQDAVRKYRFLSIFYVEKSAYCESTNINCDFTKTYTNLNKQTI